MAIFNGKNVKQRSAYDRMGRRIKRNDYVVLHTQAGYGVGATIQRMVCKEVSRGVIEPVAAVVRTINNRTVTAKLEKLHKV